MANSLPYELAGRWQHHVHALAIIESLENPDAKGDFKHKDDPHSNRARSLFQHHPATFKEYYGRSKNFPVDLNDSWVEAEIKASASLFDCWEHKGVPRCVQAHQMGTGAVFEQGKTNPEYLAKWQVAYDSLNA